MSRLTEMLMKKQVEIEKLHDELSHVAAEKDQADAQLAEYVSFLCFYGSKKCD